MTMESMVRHLESMGFETTKKYNSLKWGYDFKILKDQIRVDGFFLYPAHDSPEGRDAKQRKFLDEMIDEWHNARSVNLKGENKMDFMNYVARGGDVYLVGSEAGVYMPVRIENIEMNSLEPMRFEGHALEPIYSKSKPSYIPYDSWNGVDRIRHQVQTPSKNFPGIKAVHFSGPCTIIVWDDKTKTIVRCKDENIDYEKGFAMAVAKKVFGTNESGSNYYDIFKKYLPKPETPEEETPTEEETTKDETPEEVTPITETPAE